MAQSRNRCIYCDDSRGASVDHFVPIAIDFHQTFRWDNHLWACSDCNRLKWASFPLVNGEPTLLNPLCEYWWTVLTIDTATGVLAPRYTGSGSSQRGTDTLRVFAPLNWEPVIEGRHRTIGKIREAIATALANGDSSEVRRALTEAIRHDDYGVASWFWLGPGTAEPDMRQLQTKHRSLWRRCVSLVAAREHG